MNRITKNEKEEKFSTSANVPVVENNDCTTNKSKNDKKCGIKKGKMYYKRFLKMFLEINEGYYTNICEKLGKSIADECMEGYGLPNTENFYCEFYCDGNYTNNYEDKDCYEIGAAILDCSYNENDFIDSFVDRMWYYLYEDDRINPFFVELEFFHNNNLIKLSKKELDYIKDFEDYYDENFEEKEVDYDDDEFDYHKIVKKLAEAEYKYILSYLNDDVTNYVSKCLDDMNLW